MKVEISVWKPTAEDLLGSSGPQKFRKIKGPMGFPNNKRSLSSGLERNLYLFSLSGPIVLSICCSLYFGLMDLATNILQISCNRCNFRSHFSSHFMMMVFLQLLFSNIDKMMSLQ